MGYRLRKLTGWNYSLAKYYELLSLDHRFGREREFILVHQMGKVGSMSIYHAIKDMSPKAPIFHTHFLSKEQIVKVEKLNKANWCGPLRAGHLWQSIFVKKNLDTKKFKIITLVRDPIARNVSGFLQVLETQYNFNLKEELERSGIDGTSEKIIRLFLRPEDRHDIPLVWFDRELAPFFHIDVFSRTFPKEDAYQIIRDGRVELLIIRLEDLDVVGEGAISSFLGKKVGLKKYNVGAQKAYSEVYKAIKDKISLPDQYLSKMYDSKYARHFYTDEELKAFAEKWRGKPK